MRAARLLALTQRDVAAALGISEATASRLFAGKYLLSAERAKEWELAAAVRAPLPLARRAVGPRGDRARAGSRARTSRSARRRSDLIRTVEGLVRVVAYLDAARSRV